MSEEKKQMHFYLTIGYIGILFLVLTGLRLVMIGDSTGQTLALVSLLFISGVRSYVEKKLPKTKERSIIKRIFIILLIIVFLGGGYLLLR